MSQHRNERCGMAAVEQFNERLCNGVVGIGGLRKKFHSGEGIEQYGQCPDVEFECRREIGIRNAVGTFENMRSEIEFCGGNQNTGFLKRRSRPKSVKGIVRSHRKNRG